MLTVFCLFFLALLAGAVFISGWFAITRGRYITQPDGTLVWKGKIFSAWQRFWEQTQGEKKVYYCGKELKLLMLQVESCFGLTQGAGYNANAKYYRFNHDAPNPMCIIVDATVMLLLRDRFHVFQSSNPDIYLHIKPGTQGEFYIMFCKNVKQYVFPEWLRDPLASCIYCHSSLYGSLIWFFICAVSNHAHLNGGSICAKMAFILWLPFLISLSYVTPFLWKKL